MLVETELVRLVGDGPKVSVRLERRLPTSTSAADSTHRGRITAPAVLPPLLAGPILRRTDESGVHIWLATSVPVELYAQVVAIGGQAAVDGRDRAAGPPARDGATVGRGGARSIPLGERLHISLLRAIPEESTFPLNTLLGYNMDVRIATGTPAVFRYTSDDDRGPVLLHPSDVAYEPFNLPTFFIPSGYGQQLRFIHGSCRKLHGTGVDAMRQVDATLGRLANSLPSRPSILLLTGDQIYADDVHSDLIGPSRGIARLARYLLGYPEAVPGVESVVEDMADGERFQAVERGHFTVNAEDGTNHLLGLGEYFAMYLLAWSPEIWARFSGAFPSAEAPQTDKLRRALANVPTYMIFDDHDVTDDWNITRSWVDQVDHHPTTRRVLANALAAFWAFQAIGNNPGEHAAIESLVRAHIASGGEDGASFEDALLAHRAWAFDVPSNPPILALDTRTQRRLETRTLRLPGGVAETDCPAGLLDATALQALGQRLASLPSGRPDDPVVIISPAPVIGFTLVEWLQRFATFVDSPEDALRLSDDPEAWIFHPGAFRDFLETLRHSGRRKFVFLSGDVHYAFNAIATYTHRPATGAEETLLLVQLTSSSMKNAPAGTLARVLGPTPFADSRAHEAWGHTRAGETRIVTEDQSAPWDFRLRWRYAPFTDVYTFAHCNAGLVTLRSRGTSRAGVEQRLLIPGRDLSATIDWETIAADVARSSPPSETGESGRDGRDGRPGLGREASTMQHRARRGRGRAGRRH